MARPLRIQYPGAFYHVTCRGNERRKIFIDDDDRGRFLQLLVDSLVTYRVILYGYVMMNNHFHLVLQTLGANLSEFMRRFNICYTGWFNYRHTTCGHLYQGRYKALLVDADNYLLELSRYVHLNPVRVSQYRGNTYRERWQYLQRYRWSSLLGYLDERRRVGFIDYGLVLDRAGGYGGYKRFILDGLKEGIGDPLENVHHQMILGDDNFVVRVKNKYLGEGSLREQPIYRGMKVAVIDPGVVLDCIVKCLGVDRLSLSTRLGDGVARGIAAELLYRYSAIPQREIGRLLGGIDYTAVSLLRRRLQTRMKVDRSARAKYGKAERGLHNLCQV